MTISLIKKACESLGISFEVLDTGGVFIKANFKDDRFHYFIANNFGLNDECIEKICLDKTYLHDLLGKYIQMPNSVSYVDSDPPELYVTHSSFHSHQEIAQDISKKMSFPVILKPNSKSMGMNVFLCENAEQLQKAVETIFNKNSFKYDHVLLAQEKINIKKEYRVVVYKGEIQFAYQKDNTEHDAKFIGNVSPLHFENAKAVLISNEVFLKKVEQFIQPIFEQMQLIYGGLDIAEDASGQLYLIEINSKPGYSYFVRDNGEDKVVELFKKILKDLAAQS